MDEKICELTPEEYLTTAELSERIKMTPGTIRNLVWKNRFKKGIHYLKPTPRKLLFVWSNVQDWLHESSLDACTQSDYAQKSLINI